MNEVPAQQLGNESTCPMLVLLSLHVARIMLAQGILHSSHRLLRLVRRRPGAS
jgi:hypothetical protein